MRKLLFACLFLAGTAVAADLEPLVIRDFSAGLVTEKDPTLLPDGAAQDLQNVDVDDGSIRKRKGTLAVNSSYIGDGAPVRFLHEYVSPTNSFWLLAVSSNSLYGSTDGGATFSLLTSTHGISSTSRFQAANAFGTAYLVDGSTNAIRFDGTDVTHNTSAPIGGVTAFWADRLWVANGSTLYASRVSDATDWTDDGVDDADAFQAVVRNNNGYTITALKPFGPDLFVFKAKSIDRVTLASDGLNFGLYPITSHLGTTHPDSVVSADNAIVWLAEDGYYAYDGSQIRRISEAITPTVAQITQLDALSRSYSETDMTAGTDYNTTAERVAGQVMLAEGTFTDTSDADFSAGSISGASAATITGGQIIFFTDFRQLHNSSFETAGGGGATTISGWTSSGFWTRTSAQAYAGSYSARNFNSAADMTMYLVTSTGGVVASFPLGTSLTTWTQQTFDTSPYAGRYIYFQLCDPSYYPARAMTYDYPIWLSRTDLTLNYYHQTGYWYIDVVTGAAVDTFDLLVTPSWDDVSFVSRGYDTGGTFPTFGSASMSVVTGSNTIDYYTQYSADGVVWGSSEAFAGDGGSLGGTPLKYIRYQLDITLSTNATALPELSAAAFPFGSPSGRYLSSSINLVGATSWLPFTAVGSADGGGLTYELYMDTDTTIDVADAVTFVSSQTLTSGQTPTLTLDNYAFLAATMTTTGVPDPYVQEWQLQWGEGSVSSIVSSEFFDQKYYSAVSLGGSANDTILVYDKNGAWTKHTGLEPYYMKKYRTNLYYGDSSTGTVVRMNVDQYQDYDGAAIDAYWISKDFDLGYPLTTKSVIRYYLTAERAVDSNVTFEYGVERGALTGTSYALDQNAGFFRQVIRPTSTTYSEGIQHRFKISDDTLDGGMSVLSVSGQWRRNTNP